MAVTIVDYGLGNLGSVTNMLNRVDVDCVLTTDYQEIGRAERIIVPGVGAFDQGMRALQQSGLGDAIVEAAGQGTPVLGI